MNRFALFCIAFGFLFVFAGCAEKTPAPGDTSAPAEPPTPVEGAYTPAVPTVSDKKSGNGEFTCPASDPLPAKKHFIAAANALEVGDPAKARPELLLALCQEPDHRRAKSLLKQIDEPPKAFFGADAISLTGGCMTTDERTSTMNEIVVERAERCYVLVDSHKFGKTSFIRYASFGQIDTIFTDPGLDREALKQYGEAGARIEVARVRA